MLLAPLALQHFIICAQQVALVKVTHETSFLWQTLFLRRTRKERSREGNSITVRRSGGGDGGGGAELKKNNKKKNSKGNSKEYALLRGVNGSGMNIKAH